MNQATKIFRDGQKHIVGLRQMATKLWQKACEFDNIPVDSKFVEFSEGNKFIPFYNNVMRQYFEAVAEYQAGGYVGLTMKRR